MQGKALLIVHDPTMVEALSEALARPDLEMKFATTVGDALAILSRGRVDMAFCEARLPDGNLRELIRFLGSSGRRTPLVVCSNFYDRAIEAESVSLGADEYLTFPFARDEVQRLAAAALRKAALATHVPARRAVA